MCVYALERLAAHLISTSAGSAESDFVLDIDIFDRSGEFGCGEVNSATQSSVSRLNRVAAQLSFAADETCRSAGPLLPETYPRTFLEWLRARQHDGGGARYALGPADIPPRSLHGEGLIAAFQRHLGLLRAHGCNVTLLAAEVVDVLDEGVGSIQMASRDASGPCEPRPADHVLFVTGNADSFVAPLARACERHSSLGLRPYPLATQLDLESAPPGQTVGVAGFGLTAIDVILHLTAGRGGRFVPREDGAFRYRYEPSGREPGVIVPFSPSGCLPRCRPRNEKLADATLSYRARYFSADSLQRLRASRGRRCARRDGSSIAQLDFDGDVLPLVILEFALAYYATLLGPRFAEEAALAARPRWRRFVDGPGLEAHDAMDWLLEPIQTCFDRVEASLRTRGVAQAAAAGDAAARAFLHASATSSNAVASGSDPDPERSLAEFRFRPRDFLPPEEPTAAIEAAQWRARWMTTVRSDLLQGQQGNLANPFKAACDGVLRDLRSVFCRMLENGGLTPSSHRRFLDGFFRTYQRLSNGAGIESTAHVLALVEAGWVDVSIGPQPEIRREAGVTRVRGRWTGVERSLDVVIDGHLRPFDIRASPRPLYRNLMRRGIARPWVNAAGEAREDFIPGGLDVSERFHPIRADGREDPRMTFFGAPADGARFFQSTAARPGCDSAIFNDLGRWARELFAEPSTSLPRLSGASAQCGA